MIKFHAEFPKFVQNLETREYSAKLRIAIASKIVTGHCFVGGRGALAVGSVVPKLGEC